VDQSLPSVFCFRVFVYSRRACGNCGKAERFSRLFQAAVEIIKKKSPKATFVDFHGCVSFHRHPLPLVSFFLLLFLSL
jgi:hypothetical protein